MKRKSSMIRSLLIWNFSIITLFVFFSGLFVFTVFSNNQLERAIARNNVITTTVVENIRQMLNAHIPILESIDAIMTKRLVSMNELDAYLFTIVNTQPYIESLEIVALDGVVIHSANGRQSTEGVSRSGEPFIQWFAEHTETYWSSPFISPTTGKPTVTLVCFFHDWYIVAYLDLDEVSKYSTGFMGRFGDDVELVITDKYGVYISNIDLDAVYRRDYSGDIDNVRKTIGEGRQYTDCVHNGAQSYLSVAAIEHPQWFVLLYQSKATMVRPIAGLFLVNLIFILSVLLITVCVILYFDYRFRKQIQEFLVKTKNISEGKYQTRLSEQNYYELESLSASFNAMVESVQRKERELQGLNAELERKVHDRTRDLAVTNLELQASNRGLAGAMRELTETQGKMLVSEKLATLGRLAAGISHELNTPLAAIAAANRTVMRNFNQGIEDLILAASRLGDEALAFVRETGSRCLETASDSLVSNPETERQNRKAVLAAFTQAGVPDAGSFADEFVELGLCEYADRAARILCSSEAGDFIMTLRGIHGSLRAARLSEEAVERTSRVIAALRIYIRTDTQEKPETVFLSAMFGSLIDLYYNRTKAGIAIDLRIPDETAVFGRKEELRRIWFNLLSNAVQAVGMKGHIEIESRRTNGDVLVSITDSGPGIPDEMKSRIFEPFFTTKSAGEGTGLGLEIAQRLARENGGDITFDSRPGRTEFIVRLPAAHRDLDYSEKI